VAASFHNDREPIVGSGSSESRAMCLSLASAWVNFAKTGNPNNAQMPAWPIFDGKRRATMILGADTRVVNDPYGSIRSFWLGMPAPYSVFG
jgi:para-nitrobenzyl esterase